MVNGLCFEFASEVEQGEKDEAVHRRGPSSTTRFPQHARELDAARQTLDGGTDLINEEHPGFHDKESAGFQFSSCTEDCRVNRRVHFNNRFERSLDSGFCAQRDPSSCSQIDILTTWNRFYKIWVSFLAT